MPLSPVPAAPAPLAELAELERIVRLGGEHVQARVLCEVDTGAQRQPVYTVTLGNPDPAVPAMGFFGGIHGLERIGAEVVLAYLSHLVMRLRWDTTLHQQLQAVRLVFMPVVNPGGLQLGTRANPNGVDLMRNAPVEAQDKVPFLVGGQRLSAGLPWYRGPLGAPMEQESRALCEVVRSELLSHRFSMALDCHSGFGLSDRLWFPFAHTRRPIPHLAELFVLAQMFGQTHHHHRYIVEPQSLQYLTHGDLWDHLYLRAQARGPALFLPLTLEMGSWLWVKKNPRQLFSRHGIFNPLIEHRQQRVLRRHLPLMDFLLRAATSFERWLPAADARPTLQEQALQHWYRWRRG